MSPKKFPNDSHSFSKGEARIDIGGKASEATLIYVFAKLLIQWDWVTNRSLTLHLSLTYITSLTS